MSGTNVAKKTADYYLQELADIVDLILPEVPSWAEPVWHLFVMRYKERDKLQETLERAGIGSLIHYPVPPHLSAAYSDFGYKKRCFSGHRGAGKHGFEPTNGATS